MELKRYQRRVIEEVRAYLNTLADKQAKGEMRHAAQDAWEDAKVKGDYHTRQNGIKKDLPNFYIQVPTGGGKTLLATQILGEIYKTILRDRNGAGLVLWVVPSDQIYKDTLKSLKDRNHFYRESLEFALSRRIEVWEKGEIIRITPGQLASNLNILLLKLQGTNREDKESLKFFRDSGGNIVAHFPPEDESSLHEELNKRIPNLEMIEADPDRGRFLAKTSIANLVRLCEPAVILDEGHKATSSLAQATIEGFNPRIVVELSATPPSGVNVLARVSGRELLDEEMIKLPLNVSNSGQRDWRDVLSLAHAKREELAQHAAKHYSETEKTIRPIVLVQVERTGKDQRDKSLVHSEDAKEHLIQRLGIDESKIAIKSSEKDDIEGLNLLDEGCPVEWIITKQALQEGWDCPFAYILVSLSNTQSQRSMTQLVGRVLRQPYVTRSRIQELNESYVYCLRLKAAEIMGLVKQSLEKEGYQGEAGAVVDRSREHVSEMPRTARIQPKFLKHFGKPFEGRLFLPRFCVRNGDQYEGLDYYRHLLAKVNVEDYNYAGIEWDLSDQVKAAYDQFFKINLGGRTDSEEVAIDLSQPEEITLAWLIHTLDVDFLSVKQKRFVVEQVRARLSLGPKEFFLARFALREQIAGLVEQETDRLTELVFRQLYEQGTLCFFLECTEGRFEVPYEVQIRSTQRLRTANDTDLKKSLFDYIPQESTNGYERDVALYLDNHPEVLWWYRNIVGRESFTIQGYRRHRIYPDFVVQQGHDENKPLASVLVIESKGEHLKGSEDTEYKRNVAKVFSDLGKEVPWQDLGAGFDKHRFRFQVLDQGEYAGCNWETDLNKWLKS